MTINSSNEFQQIPIISVSVHCKCLKCKICQTVASISMTSQFHEFLKFVLLRNFAFWPDCASELSDLTIFSSSNERADSHNFRFCSLQALEMQNLSNCCKHKYDQSISRVFKICFLAGFCFFYPTVPLHPQFHWPCAGC